MTTVYGNQIEPGGMKLDDDRAMVTCPSCGCPDAVSHIWEACEGGSINTYHHFHCPACGHSEGNDDSDDDEPMDFDFRDMGIEL